ncbi:MAG: dimethylarginine dimethylaminohydrolase family protein [Acidimicrobiales bacterium]
MSPLRYLMCPPAHFGVLYEINPWMHRDVKVDPELAMLQWEGLFATMRAAGASIELIEPAAAVPDLVFTANAGIVIADLFVPSHFRHVERQAETPIFTRWFAERGHDVRVLPDDMRHEGAGDALPFGGVLLSGHGSRSDTTAADMLSALLAVPVQPIALVEPRLYHLDLTFCPLDDRHALCAPLGWNSDGLRAIEELVAEPLWLTDEEALAFCANSVVVGSTIVMPSAPVRVARQLEAWGYEVVECSVGEFLKAGGGCRCLTLALDVDL